MTGAKLKKSFVCKEHNALTNDRYEKYFIANLDFYRNCLGLKTRTGEEIKYRADVSAGKTKIENFKLSDREAFFNPKEIVSGKSNDGSKILLGPTDKLAEIVSLKEESKINMLDISDVTIHKKVSNGVFADYYAVHSIAKIAYEWHCYINGIEEYQDTYREIVNYILGIEDFNMVEIVTDGGYYDAIDKLSEVGTNSFLEYDDLDGYRYVIFDLWKTIAYKVRIGLTPVTCKSKIVRMEFNFAIYFYHLDGSQNNDSFKIQTSYWNLGVTINADSPEKLNAKIWQFIFKRSLKLLSTINLSIRSIRKDVDLLEKDLIDYDEGKIKFDRLVKYEDEKRVVLIGVINKLYVNFGNYEMDKSFNANLGQILNANDYCVTFSTDAKDQLLRMWLKLDIENQFSDYLRKRIDVFNNIYKNEMIRESNS